MNNDFKKLQSLNNMEEDIYQIFIQHLRYVREKYINKECKHEGITKRIKEVYFDGRNLLMNIGFATEVKPGKFEFYAVEVDVPYYEITIDE